MNRTIKLKVAQVLAATIFVYILVSVVYNPIPIELRPLAGIGAVASTIATFVLSWKQRSSLIAGLLLVSGVAGTIYGLMISDYLRILIIPGPILGFLIGILILGFGIAKTAMVLTSVQDKTATTAR